MNKLIAVGMRYQDLAAVQKVIDARKILERVEVHLDLERNCDGVDGWAIGVWYNKTKVAFIRNKDVEEAVKKDVIRYRWVITQMYTNYWVLERLVSSKPDTNTNVTTEANPTIKESKKMNIGSNMRDSFFREIKNVALDLQTGKFGVTSSEGLSVYINGEVLVNPITEFGIKIPAFAMRIPVKDLNEGDIVVNGNDFSFFKDTKAANEGYTVVSLNGEVKQVGNVSNLFFGKNSVLAVKNMFGDTAAGMNPLMLAMMLGDGKEFDMKTFALMSMMGGMGGGAAPGGMDLNMLMMMTLMGK